MNATGKIECDIDFVKYQKNKSVEIKQLHSIEKKLHNNVTTSINSTSSSSFVSSSSLSAKINNDHQLTHNNQSKNDINTYKSINNATIVPNGYLIYGPECKIPDIDPLAKDVMKLFHREEYR